jgi:hypothetical protein
MKRREVRHLVLLVLLVQDNLFLKIYPVIFQ